MVTFFQRLRVLVLDIRGHSVTRADNCNIRCKNLIGPDAGDKSLRRRLVEG
jgi:hypothetical protein